MAADEEPLPPEGKPGRAREGEPGTTADESVPPEGGKPGRPCCSRCRRPCSTCICPALPPDGPLETRTRIAVLVHPKEVQRALGTVPLLRLCLRNLVIRVGDRFPEPEQDPAFHEDLHAGGHRCVLVCPGPEAEELRPPQDGDTSPAEGPPTTLIFIDGRWPQAKSMVHRSQWLREGLPRAVLCPTEQSGYVFRKQPGEGCLSTLEAVAEALLALEGPRGPALKAALVAPFRRMVEFQCPYIPDLKDKNAELGSKSCPSHLFDAEAVLAEFGPEGGQDELGHDLEVHCVVRWGSSSVSGREVVVAEVQCCSRLDAKRRAVELSIGCSRGHRCWVLPVGKVPPGARMEPPCDGAGAARLPGRCAGADAAAEALRVVGVVAE